jgi:hypothetical protein
MSKIVVAEGVEATPEMLRRVEGRYFLPGEKVRLLPGDRCHDESPSTAAARRSSLPAELDLVIAETRLMRGEAGDPIVAYMFEGIGGVHRADAFGWGRELLWHYGVLIQRTGITFLVPLDDRAEQVTEADGPAIRIDVELLRSARYAFGIGDGPEDGAIFFAALETEPMIGEFHVLLNEDGTATLAYSSWTSSTSANETAIAEDAISALGHSARPASIN